MKVKRIENVLTGDGVEHEGDPTAIPVIVYDGDTDFIARGGGSVETIDGDIGEIRFSGEYLDLSDPEVAERFFQSKESAGCP